MFNPFSHGQGRERYMPDSVIEQMARIQINAATPFLQMMPLTDEERVRYLDNLIDGLERLRGEMDRRPYRVHDDNDRRDRRPYDDDDRRDRGPPPRRSAGNRRDYDD
jgi:hypothetical protein